MRWWRLLLMLIVAAGLCVALIPTGNGLWLPDPSSFDYNLPVLAPFSYFGMPAICFFEITVENTRQLFSMIISMFVLITSYSTRAIKLFQWSSEKSRKWFRTIPGGVLSSVLDELHTRMQAKHRQMWTISVPYWLILCVYIVLKACFDLAESMVWEITWLPIALIWGTLRLFSTRNLTTLRNGADSPAAGIFEENAWGFGQCLSTVMLLLVIFAIAEVYYETSQRFGDVAKAMNNNPMAEDRTSTQVLPHIASSPNRGNNNDRIGSIELVAEDTVEQDISTQSRQTTYTTIPFEALLRSSTDLSLEERTIGRNLRLSSCEQGSHSGFQSTSQSAMLFLCATQVTAPHHENFYQYGWFESLIMLIFIHALSLSIFVLPGEYGENFSSGYNAIFQDPFKLFLLIFTWITLYAPGTAIIYTSYSLFPRATAHWRWRIRLAKWYNSKWPRPHTLRLTQVVWVSQRSLILALLLFSILLLYIPSLAIWEGWVPGGSYLTRYVAAILIAIGVPWTIVLREKLRRQVRILS